MKYRISIRCTLYKTHAYNVGSGDDAIGDSVVDGADDTSGTVTADPDVTNPSPGVGDTVGVAVVATLDFFLYLLILMVLE